MPYDFTTMLPREGQDAIAVEKIPIPGAQIRDGFSRIPMWVADMNFATLPAITESIIRRAQHPAFGYFQPRKEYFDAIIRWQAERNGVQGLTPEDIGYVLSTPVVPEFLTGREFLKFFLEINAGTIRDPKPLEKLARRLNRQSELSAARLAR